MSCTAFLSDSRLSSGSAFASAEFAALHMFYHLGQVNYVQAMYGNPAVHWM